MSAELLSSGWRRMHPVSPLVKGWKALAAILVLRADDAVGGGGAEVGPTAVLIGAVVMIGGVYNWLAWRVGRYRLDGAVLVVETGVLFRRSRRVPLARLQAVEVVRPLVARAIGLAELRLEVAGGKSSDASLAYLDEAAAHRVRNELLALAAGLRDDVHEVSAPAEAAETVIASVPTTTLLVAHLITGPGPVFVAALIGLGAVSAIAGQPAIAATVALPALFGLGGSVWTSFSRDYGTTLAESADGLRVRRGLLETRAQTVPPGRVQGVVVREPMLWRPLGWARVAATVAGYVGGESERSTTLLPVAARALGIAIVARVLPGFEWEKAGAVTAPRRARWRAPIEAPRLSIWIGDEGAERVFVTRRGRLGLRTDIVPLARVQSVRLTQGPVQRLLRLATVHADLSAGPVRAAGLHRDESEARQLVDRLVDEARRARAASRPDRWMTRVVSSE